jgi:hypothetical protein
MFDLTKQPILLALAAVASFTIGACFNGAAAEGLPCTNDLQCGPGVGCIDGFCAGVFLCADGTLLDDAAAACNGALDCEDKSDEDADLCGGGGANVNQCDEPDGDLVYQLGPSTSAPGDASKVEALDIMGSPTPDAIVASRDGDSVKVAFDLESAPKEYFFGGMPQPFGDRTVFGYEVGEVNGDMKQDVVIITTGTDAAVYVYQNMSPNPPEPFGAAITVPDMLGEVTLRSFQLGRLNNDSSTDIVAILDLEAGAASVNGLLLVSFGDSMADANGLPYFNPQALPELPLGYELFVDSVLADLNGDGFDDLLVVGAGSNGPGLWIVHRSPAGDAASWEDPFVISIMAPGLIAAGYFEDAPAPGQPLPGMPDIAILDPNNGSIETLLNMNGMLQPGSLTTLSGSGYAALTLADINCDRRSDFVYNLTEPPEIRVLFGDGLGGVRSEVPLAYVDEGNPRGGLGIALFDEDATPDIFSAADPGEGQMDTRVRVLVSGEQ